MAFYTAVTNVKFTAVEFNTYVRDRLISTFTSTSARDAEVTTPVEGMLVYIQADDSFYMYNGSVWNKVLTPYSISGPTAATPNSVVVWDTNNRTIKDSPIGYITNGLQFPNSNKIVGSTSGMVLSATPSYTLNSTGGITLTGTTTTIAGTTTNISSTSTNITSTNVSITGVTDAPTSYTPVLTASVTNPNLGSTGGGYGQYVKIGKLVFYSFYFVFAGSGISAGSGEYRISLPFAADTSVISFPYIGTAAMRDSSTTNRLAGATLEIVSSTTVRAGWGQNTAATMYDNSPWVWASADTIHGTCTYFTT